MPSRRSATTSPRANIPGRSSPLPLGSTIRTMKLRDCVLAVGYTSGDFAGKGRPGKGVDSHTDIHSGADGANIGFRHRRLEEDIIERDQPQDGCAGRGKLSRLGQPIRNNAVDGRADRGIRHLLTRERQRGPRLGDGGARARISLRQTFCC